MQDSRKRHRLPLPCSTLDSADFDSHGEYEVATQAELARRLGFSVDLIGVRGSGATTTRIELLRRKDNLIGKKVVIWCFSFREFTESNTGWRKVRVIRPSADGK